MNDQQQRNPLFGKGKAQGANAQMRGQKQQTQQKKRRELRK